MVVTGIKRLAPLILLALPVVMSVLSLDFKRAEGAYWEAHKVDPSYAYLVGSLAYAMGQPSMCCLHPGVTAQINGAWTLRLSHAVLGQDDLVADVVRDPEVYAALLGFEATLLYALALLVAGWLVYRATGRIELALVMQLAPYLNPAFFNWLNPIAPEAILFAVITLVAALGFVYSAAQSPGNSLFAVVFGVLSGMGLATKITYLPTGIMPLLLLGSWSARLIYLLATGLSFAAISIPHWATVDNALYFWSQLLHKRGLHGSGEAGAMQLPELAGFVGEYIRTEPVYVWLLLLSIGFAVAMVWTARRRQERFSRLSWYLIVLLLSELAQIALASRQFNPRYLSPAYILLSANLVVIVLWLRSAYLGVARILSVACVGLIALIVTLDARDLSRKMTQLRFRRDEFHRIDRKFLAENAGAKVIAYYGASTIPYALQFGNQWAYRRFSNELAARYPDTVFWDAYRRTFERFDAPIKPEDLGDCSANILRGAPFGVQPMGFSVPPGFEVEEIGRTAQEAFYRIRSAPCIGAASETVR